MTPRKACAGLHVCAGCMRWARKQLYLFKAHESCSQKSPSMCRVHLAVKEYDCPNQKTRSSMGAGCMWWARTWLLGRCGWQGTKTTRPCSASLRCCTLPSGWQTGRRRSLLQRGSWRAASWPGTRAAAVLHGSHSGKMRCCHCCAMRARVAVMPVLPVNHAAIAQKQRITRHARAACPGS